MEMYIEKTSIASIPQQRSCLTLFVACNNKDRGIPADHSVGQEHVQELCHVSHLLLKDATVHYKDNGSEERERDISTSCLSGRALVFEERPVGSHLAADLNFSRYWGRRPSCPGRSMRVQVLPWGENAGGMTSCTAKGGGAERHSRLQTSTHPVVFRSVRSTTVSDGGLGALELPWKQLSKTRKISLSLLSSSC